jgi:tryptophanyl-tRNA synthetase
MKRILSGIKPTGKLHIGNYFGMMRPAIEWQEKGEAFYFVADYHALTTLRNPAELRENSRRVAADFLACGLDPEKAVFFRQSDVPQVTELTWILSTVTPMPMLENAHAYKAQVARGTVPNLGLFAYPVLMAVDILIYDSDIVPVGRDQQQHVEIARDLAGKMNLLYGNLFKIPEASVLPHLATVVGLDGQKMSKSYGNTIEVFLDEKSLRKKIMGIVTDSTAVDAPKNPDASSILSLYSLVASPADTAAMREGFLAGGKGYGDFKRELFEAIWSFFAPMRKKHEELDRDPAFVEQVLKQGAERAQAIADEMARRVRKAVGLD